MIERALRLLSTIAEFLFGLLAYLGEFIIWLLWTVVSASGYGVFPCVTIVLFLLLTPARERLEKLIYPALVEYQKTGIANLGHITRAASDIVSAKRELEAWTAEAYDAQKKHQKVAESASFLHEKQIRLAKQQIELFHRLQNLVDHLDYRLRDVEKRRQSLDDARRARADRRRRENPGENDDLFDDF